MEVEEAIRTRRTHKAYRPEPVDRGTLEELLDLARWAPNHNLTNPWRFRVIGPEALERLKEAAGPESASKLDRAPTLVVCSCALTGDPIQDEEDLHATACAAYIVLLAAHGRGLATYWRTPEVLRTPRGTRGRGHARGRAVRRPASPGTASAGAEAPGANARRPGRGVPRLDDLPRPGARRNRRRTTSTWSSSAAASPAPAWPSTRPRADTRSRSSSAHDFGRGTSSRSSKMVHGGLRYLQNFDLGLVREALLERQLLVRLAPHLVYPTPFLVPAVGEERRDRRIGIGLNMYDVMATSRIGRGRSQRNEHAEEAEYWSPDRHRTISGEEAAELIPALEPLDPSSAYLFYDCQTDDVRLVLTVLGEAERFGAVVVNGAEVTEVLDEGGRAAGVAFTEKESGERLEVRPTTWSTRPGSGPTGSGPTSCSPRRRSRGSVRAGAPT